MSSTIFFAGAANRMAQGLASPSSDHAGYLSGEEFERNHAAGGCLTPVRLASRRLLADARAGVGFERAVFRRPCRSSSRVGPRTARNS